MIGEEGATTSLVRGNVEFKMWHATAVRRVQEARCKLRFGRYSYGFQTERGQVLSLNVK